MKGQSGMYRMPVIPAASPWATTGALPIVHELIHLELAGLPRSEASRSQEEHVVNRIAESLLRRDSRR